jgi:hypothetical protein
MSSPPPPRHWVDPAKYTLRGSSPNFHVYFDNRLGGEGSAIADRILQNCEADYEYVRAIFQMITPPFLPFSIIVVPGEGGAQHDQCADTLITCDAANGERPGLPGMVVLAEVVECFEAALGAGWNCKYSNGEGLSRVLSMERYPQELRYVSARFWLNGPRRDWVTTTDPDDRNYEAVGCATLFLNYLRYQLGFGWDEIVAAGADDLATTYNFLTGNNDAFAPFAALLAARFPPGTPTGFETDNPFPLP